MWPLRNTTEVILEMVNWTWLKMEFMDFGKDRNPHQWIQATGLLPAVGRQGATMLEKPQQSDWDAVAAAHRNAPVDIPCFV